MIKISYPSNSVELTRLQDEYWELFKDQESVFDSMIKASPNFVKFFNTVSYRQIVLGGIQELVDLFCKFDALPLVEKDNINKDFKYIFSYNQPVISHFFEKNDSIFHLRACHYCNLDSVSVFSTLHGYKDDQEFIRHACKRELRDIAGIGRSKAKAIIGLPDRQNYVDSPNSPSFVKNYYRL
ncbi:MAG: hypothetical protein RSF40_08560 [Oscillospiraceae bacterium]